jgi:hypothetical protein
VGEPADIVEKQRQVAFRDAGRVARDVRGDDHVFHGPQGMPGGQRLGLEDVQSGAGDLVGFERRDQIVEHHDGAAADVDEIARGFHPPDHGPVEEAPGFRGVRRRDHHEVAFREQFGQPIRAP